MSPESKLNRTIHKKIPLNRAARPIASILLSTAIMAAAHKDNSAPVHDESPPLYTSMDLVVPYNLFTETSPPPLENPAMREEAMIPGVIHNLQILPTPSATPEPTPAPAPKIEPPKPSGVQAQAVQSFDLNSIVSAMYQQESQSGLTDPCVISGKGFNGYGYAPGTCYSSHEEVSAKVKNWIMDKIQNGWPLSQALCYYQSGYILSDCDYYRSVLGIANRRE
ncbi:MAG: hypothetical protein ACM3IJ_01980 [Candidatus Levyibacteriota bacterium]